MRDKKSLFKNDLHCSTLLRHTVAIVDLHKMINLEIITATQRCTHSRQRTPQGYVTKCRKTPTFFSYFVKFIK